jgi:hypothetical protein
MERLQTANGVVTRVKEYGNSIEGVRCILQYTEASCEATRNWQNVIKKLETIGYQVGKDLFSALYDFQRGPDDYMDDDFPKLKELVESIYKTSNDKQPVALMSISLGSVAISPHILHTLCQPVLEGQVHKTMVIHVRLLQWICSVVSKHLLRSRYFYDYKGFKTMDVRNAYRSWLLSAIWLIPREAYGDNRVILRTARQNYTLSDVKNILPGDQADMYSRLLLYNVSADPGIPTDCWFVLGRRTTIAQRALLQ